MPLARRLLALAMLLPLCTANAFASPAGTVVSNTARLAFEVEGAQQTVPSNTVDIVLAERLDVRVMADAPTAPAPSAGETGAFGFRVVNGGNGAEAFDLTAKASVDGAPAPVIAADEDGNGRFDPAIDRQLQSAQLHLDAGQEKRLFVIVGGLHGGNSISLTASAATGTGAAGTVFTGKGDAGGDAVVGETGASASAQTLLTSAALLPSLLKEQSVSAPGGGNRAVKGAVITYTLTASFPAPITAVALTDPIPAGTAYVAGSLTLDGAPLADADHFDGAAINVALGDIAAAGRRIIRFQVTIQ